MGTQDLTILILWGGGWLILFYLLMRREIRTILIRLITQISPEQKNSEGEVVKAVKTLLEQARKEFEVYDDGDDQSVLYNSEEFLETVENKLDADSNFRVKAMFNVEHELEFTQKFKGHDQVDIYIRREGVPPEDVHYKIIDGGKKAYLSRHIFQQKERRYQWVDCTSVPRKMLPQANIFWFDDIRQKADNFRLIGRNEDA